MEKINLNIGSKIFVSNQKYEIRKQIDLKTVLALNLLTNKLENISINHIKNEKESSDLIINEDIPEEHWIEAKNRLEIITPLLEKQTTKKLFCYFSCRKWLQISDENIKFNINFLRRVR